MCFVVLTGPEGQEEPLWGPGLIGLGQVSLRPFSEVLCRLQKKDKWPDFIQGTPALFCAVQVCKKKMPILSPKAKKEPHSELEKAGLIPDSSLSQHSPLNPFGENRYDCHSLSSSLRSIQI